MSEAEVRPGVGPPNLEYTFRPDYKVSASVFSDSENESKPGIGVG